MWKLKSNQIYMRIKVISQKCGNNTMNKKFNWTSSFFPETCQIIISDTSNHHNYLFCINFLHTEEINGIWIFQCLSLVEQFFSYLTRYVLLIYREFFCDPISDKFSRKAIRIFRFEGPFVTRLIQFRNIIWHFKI